MSGAEKDAEHLRIPDLRLSQTLFELTRPDISESDHDQKMTLLMEGIDKNTMATWYEYLGEKGHIKIDKEKLKSMKEKVVEELKKLDEKIETAEKEEGDSELRDAMVDRAEFLAKTGDRIRAVQAFRKIRQKCHTTVGFRLDLIFHQLRLALFYSDNFKEDIPEGINDEPEDKASKNDIKDDKDKIKDKIITNPHDFAQNLAEAKRLVEEGGDWDRRNRLKVYEALHFVHIREFSKAATLFLETVPTFTSYELMSYGELVSYTVVTSLVSLSRKQLKKDLIEGSDVQQQLYDLSDMKQYLQSFYNCQYDEFFIYLSKVEVLLKNNRYFSQHTQHYIREMRLAGYRQLLASYSSLAIGYMATAFGVTEQFIDDELSKFIAHGRLSAKIDHVAGIVVTNRPDLKNQQYRKVVKTGDNLLNRVQKLSRVINI